ncbi:Anthranilate synthase component I [Ignavibacterium album JCM 16511]|uniref:Anthranilate synthase component 1 n=2 Tax=Ignavibacterium album TaxID=591197 RepID=I0AM84_IGNAJ|nr:Anthranilate synthase component I [Ignavibacterium album JCM 16511]
MELKKFKELAENFNLIPIYEIITADLLTPVLAYAKLRQKGMQSFLLESVQGSLSMARYSFIGINPEKIILNRKNVITEKVNGKSSEYKENIFTRLKKETENIRQVHLPELPEFTGGLVGFLGYENISLIEPVVEFNYKSKFSYDSNFGLYKTIIAFDHYKHQIILINNAYVKNDSNLDELYSQSKETLSELKKILLNCTVKIGKFRLKDNSEQYFDKQKFYNLVEKCKEEIRAGEIFQIVLSKRFSTEFSGELINVYRALRIINPSPYMYFLENADGFSVLGTSPEDLLRIKNRLATVLPIAGTRRRGKDESEDIQLEKNLLNDPKELAEHTMLVDLGRNDLGRVCKYGTVRVSEFMKIQRYSHVMHIVSKVEGELRDEVHPIDALKSCFPAGTVSGAPKIRAMQLISKYENEERNIYAGAVGYIDFSGNLDMCIAIRTLFSDENKIYWQAGAGIVADSVPEKEALEINNKSAVMLNALKYAEVIDENSGN